MRRCFLLRCAAEIMEEQFDAVVVGGGPAGLSTAIRLKQLRPDSRVALIEKGAEIGSHTLSGACIETVALDELLPKWRQDQSNPIRQPVSEDHMMFLTKNNGWEVPYLPPTLHNDKNFIVSLGSVCKWLGEVATGLGVEIYPGFAASQLVLSDDSKTLLGVQLNDVGINRKGIQGPNYQPGMIFKGKQTIFAEGCRGSCTKKLEKLFHLRDKSPIQTYGLGIKEVWEVPKAKHRPGQVTHTVGWPLTSSEGHQNTYGGSFVYHYGDCLVSAGFVVALDYKNPYIRPYMEMQKWKTHPFVSKIFEGAKPIGYGARTIVEGGLSSLPKLFFPGGVLVGDCAGFLNLPKIKGTHCAIKSGMLAAEAIDEDVHKKGSTVASSYEDRFRSSWLYQELYEVRNVRQHFSKKFYWGMIYTGITAAVTHGCEPNTLPHLHADHESLLPKEQCRKIENPKPDGKLTFDLLTNHSRSGTQHNADQPAHLKLTKWEVAHDVNLAKFGGPESCYCPAGVYEFVDAPEATLKKKLVINAQNCVHCKACDIKDPTQNINWHPPEGGGGPNYNASM